MGLNDRHFISTLKPGFLTSQPAAESGRLNRSRYADNLDLVALLPVQSGTGGAVVNGC